MAGVRSKPTFLVLPNLLPTSEVPEMIGRFVTNINNPLANSLPKDPLTILETVPCKTVQTEAKVALSKIKDDTLRLFLDGLFSVGVKPSTEVSHAIEDTTIITYRLQDQFESFDKLISTSRVYDAIAGPGGLLARNDGRLYWVTGIKTCKDARVTSGNKRKQEYNVTVTLPLAAAFGLPVPDFVNPGVEMGTSRTTDSTVEGRVSGEHIFAIEYMKVSQRSIFGYSSARPVKSAKEAMEFGWGNAVYSGEKNAKIDLTEFQNSQEQAPLSSEVNADSELQRDAFNISDLDREGEALETDDDLCGWLSE